MISIYEDIYFFIMAVTDLAFKNVYNLMKCAKYETCAFMHKFHILYNLLDIKSQLSFLCIFQGA